MQKIYKSVTQQNPMLAYIASANSEGGGYVHENDVAAI